MKQSEEKSVHNLLVHRLLVKEKGKKLLLPTDHIIMSTTPTAPKLIGLKRYLSFHNIPDKPFMTNKLYVEPVQMNKPQLNQGDNIVLFIFSARFAFVRVYLLSPSLFFLSYSWLDSLFCLCVWDGISMHTQSACYGFDYALKFCTS